MVFFDELVMKSFTLRQIFDQKCVDVIIQCLLSDRLRRSTPRRLSWHKGWDTPKPVNKTMSIDIWRRLPTFFQTTIARLPFDSVPVTEVEFQTNDEPDEDERYNMVD